MTDRKLWDFGISRGDTVSPFGHTGGPMSTVLGRENGKIWREAGEDGVGVGVPFGDPHLDQFAFQSGTFIGRYLQIGSAADPLDGDLGELRPQQEAGRVGGGSRKRRMPRR